MKKYPPCLSPLNTSEVSPRPSLCSLIQSMYLSSLWGLSTASDIELFRIIREWAIPIDFLYKCSTCLFVFHAISLRSQVEAAETEMSNGELGFEPFLTSFLTTYHLGQDLKVRLHQPHSPANSNSSSLEILGKFSHHQPQWMDVTC
jgi:hypothetical protein